MFQEKRIHQYTWQHPGSKKWHCIDCILMWQAQRSLCCDVRVLRSTDCWTDHKLLHGKLKIRVSSKRAQAVTRKRFDVNGLKNNRVCDLLVERAKELVEECWDKVTSEKRCGRPSELVWSMLQK